MAQIIPVAQLFRWRLPILLLWIAFSVAATLGVAWIPLKTDYKEYFAKDDPNLLADQAMSSTYIPGDNVVFVLAPANGQALSPRALQQQLEMTEKAWQLPYSVRVDSLINYQYIYAEDDDLFVKDLIEDPNFYVGDKLDQLRQTIIDDTDIEGRLLSLDESAAAIAVSFRLPGESITETMEVAKASRALIKEFNALYPDTKIYLTGMMMGNYTPIEVILDDAQTLVPTMCIVIILLLTFLFRSFYATTLTMLIVLLAVASTMGLWGWVGAILSGPSASAPIIILTIAVADCVHLLASFFHSYQQGSSKRDAIQHSLQLNAMPVIITSVTTAIGFLSMNFSDVPPFNILGNAVAVGVLIACVASLTLLPILIDYLPIKPHSQKEDKAHLTRFAHSLVQHRKWYFIISAVMCIGLVSQAPNNEINDQFGKYFSEKTEFRQSTDFAADKLSSLYEINVSLKSPYERGIYDPRYIELVDQFEEWLLQHPKVLQTQTIATTFKSLNKAMHGNDPDWYTLPTDAELIAQYFLLYEFSLPFGLDSTQQVSFDKSESRINVTLMEMSTNETLAVNEDIKKWLDDNAADYEYYNSSIMLMFSNLGVSNANSMLTGTAMALIIMSLVIGLALRSIKLGLISLLTNIVPAALAFGVWSMISGEVGLSISIAIGMTLGIVVDNTVHLLSKYQKIYQQSADPKAAIEFAFSHVGKALLICNGVLIAGFMILAQSDFRINSDMGLFTSITFLLAVAVDFLLLPPILYWLDSRKARFS